MGPLVYLSDFQRYPISLGLRMYQTMEGSYVNLLLAASLLATLPLMLLFLFTMYFTGGIVPSYLLYNQLGMINTVWVLLIPGTLNVYNMIIARSFFESGLPEPVFESARIDGANDLVILFRIVLPLSMATVAVMILFYGVSHWNAWFDAMIFLRTRGKYPLQLILREILVNDNTEAMTMGMGADDVELLSDNLKYATIVVATLPILCVYPLIQKHFVKGVMIGAVKG